MEHTLSTAFSLRLRPAYAPFDLGWVHAEEREYGREPNKLDAVNPRTLWNGASHETGPTGIYRSKQRRNDTICDSNSSDLWDSMPTVDSKTVARTSPIFRQHLGRPLDVKLIRPGGYQSIDDMINHLVPAMMLKVS